MSRIVQKAHQALVESSRELLRHVNAIPCPKDLENQSLNRRMAEMERAYRHVRMAFQIVSSWEEKQAATTTPSAGPPGSAPTSAFKGDTKTIPLAKLISFLGMQAKTGVLHIATRTEKVQIVFDEGSLIHAASDNAPAGFRLGEMLVKTGKIEQAQLDQFLALHEGQLARLGESMTSEGLVSDEDLREVLMVQVQELFHRVALEPRAEFSFVEGLPELTDRRIRVNVDSLLLESARQKDETPSG